MTLAAGERTPPCRGGGQVWSRNERLASFKAAGLDLPILVPPIGVDRPRAVMNAFKT